MTARLIFEQMTTPQILAWLRSQEGRRTALGCAGCGGRCGGRTALGCAGCGGRCGGRTALGCAGPRRAGIGAAETPPPPGLADRAEQVLTQGWRLAVSTTPLPLVAAGVEQGAKTMQNLAVQAVGLPGEALKVLSDRMGQAAELASEHAANAFRNLAKGAGDGYREFFGFPPIVAVLLGLVVVAGGGYLLLSPGGQALLTRGGPALLEGIGKALGSVAL